MLAGYEARLDKFKALGASIVAASVDSIEKAAEVAKDLSFPVAHGVTRDIGDKMGAWWEEKRDFIQPSEFVMNQQGRIISSTYSSSPVGRTDPEDLLMLLQFLESRKK
ncbi:MAG: redoxin domain-containing protein [Gammaproteobacteria bacterium]|nr:redoxin domain-containing protein [Gammaproteobacteria bacterium]